MTGALVILVFTVAVGFLLWLFDRRNRTREAEAGTEDISEEDAVQEPEEECCGMHITCEKSSLSPHSMEVEYFDDEELDEYRGREADSYTEEEIERFREVLLTLRPTEIAPWARSVQLRGIELPQAVRDELLMIVAEERAKTTTLKREGA